MKNTVLAACLLSCLTGPLSATAAEWSGTVIGISDGDTVKVLTPQKQIVRIRLAEVDAPESKQAFGAQSKQSLADICFQKLAIVKDYGTDKYNRTIAKLQCAGVDANKEQVKRGLAWAYRQYLTDMTIAEMELTARIGRIGLWADNNPTPPWVFRHGK